MALRASAHRWIRSAPRSFVAVMLTHESTKPEAARIVVHICDHSNAFYVPHLHEVAHLVHLNHGPDFHALVAEIFGADPRRSGRIAPSLRRP